MVPLELLSLSKAAINSIYKSMGIHEAMEHSFALHLVGHATEPVQEFDRMRREKSLRGVLGRRNEPFQKAVDKRVSNKSLYAWGVNSALTGVSQCQADIR